VRTLKGELWGADALSAGRLSLVGFALTRFRWLALRFRLIEVWVDRCLGQV
jgi:hypothetical protein